MKAASPNGGGSVYTQPQTVLPPVVNPAVANDELLQRIRKSAGQVFADLKNFVCREDIERFKGNAKDPNGRKLDVITSTVAYYADGEHYSDIYRNNKPLFRISGLQGAWSEGDYGTMLGETVEALESAQVRFISNTQLEGVPAVVYAFSFTSSDTPWSMRVSGRTHLLPFKGQVWASPTTGDILRIDRIADDVPQATGISGVNWSVTFGPAQVDGKSYWLPSKGIYSVSYLDGGRHEWNLIAFSGYRRYGADVTIRFQ